MKVSCPDCDERWDIDDLVYEAGEYAGRCPMCYTVLYQQRRRATVRQPDDYEDGFDPFEDLSGLTVD